MQWMKRCSLGIVLLLCLQFLQMPVYAKDTNKIWGSVQGQQAILYIQDATVPSDLACQIGNTAVTVSEITRTTDLETPIETYILIDNSMSITQAQRPVVQEILEDLVGNRMNGERFSIAYLADSADWQCENLTEYLEIKTVIDNLTYQLQETQLTDTLYDVVTALQDSDEGILRRIIVIADGMDHKQMGYTREELEAAIKDAGYPVYTIGCDNTESNGQELLENFLALSRLTGGTAVYLQEYESAADVAAAVTDWNNAYRLTVDLPDTLCDGATRTVLLKEGEREFTTSLTMPFAVIDETAAVEEAEPAETGAGISVLDMLKAHSQIVMIAIAAVAGIVILILAIVLIRRLLQRRRQQEPALEPETAIQEDDDGTVLLRNDGNTAYLWGNGEDDDPSARQVILQDVASPSHSYAAAVSGVVTVGRDINQCRIVIDYDMAVSRHQCDLYMEAGRVMIRNCSNSNVTKVNGERIYEPVALESGATIGMGRIQLTVEII